MHDYVRLSHQASFLTHKPVQNYLSEFPKKCKSNEFPREICEKTLENNYCTEARLGGDILDSDVSMYKAYFIQHFWKQQQVFSINSKSL